MNIPKTDFQSVAKLIGLRPAEAALPVSLDDLLLHQIARDLRLMERSHMGAEDVKPPLAGPMFLICHILLNEFEKLTGQTEFEFGNDDLQHWLQRYMFYVERELVSRVINVPCEFDSEFLLTEVRENFLTKH